MPINSNDYLEELSERLAFCGTKIIFLDEEVRGFFKNNLQIKFKEVSNKKVDVLAALNVKLPVSIRSNTGMIANEIRACLDGLACNLAERNGKTTGGVSFPISKSKDIFEIDGLKKLKKLSQEDKDKIIALNPYREGNANLWHLHESDRIRKHIGLNPSFAVTDIVFEGDFMIEDCVGTTIDGKHIEYVGSGYIGNNEDACIIHGMDKGISFEIFPKVVFTHHRDLGGLNHIDVLRSALSNVVNIIDEFK